MKCFLYPYAWGNNLIRALKYKYFLNEHTYTYMKGHPCITVCGLCSHSSHLFALVFYDYLLDCANVVLQKLVHEVTCNARLHIVISRRFSENGITSSPERSHTA